MIFVAVGTEWFPFDRLVRAVDHMATQVNGEPVVVQLGHSTYVPTACTWTRFLPFPELRRHVEEARIVVSHAGAGMLLLCAQAGKIPIVVPRRKRFAEHVDDHQVELASRMAQSGYAVLAERAEDIGSLILQHDQQRVPPGPGQASAPRLAQVLKAYLDTEAASAASS